MKRKPSKEHGQDEETAKSSSNKRSRMSEATAAAAAFSLSASADAAPSSAPILPASPLTAVSVASCEGPAGCINGQQQCRLISVTRSSLAAAAVDRGSRWRLLHGRTRKGRTAVDHALSRLPLAAPSRSMQPLAVCCGRFVIRMEACVVASAAVLR